MSEPVTIDLTDPSTLEYYSNFASSVIELNDTSSPMSLRRARRSQRHRDVQSFVSPIEVLDYSRENIDESLPQNIKNTSEKMNQLSQPTQVKPNRKRSPPASINIDCVICLETFKDQPLVSTFCGHVFCQSCLAEALRKEKKCPTCRRILRGKLAYHQIFLYRQ